MIFAAGSKALSTKDLETWLSKAFVPIEPSELFVKKLRAKLVRYHGKQPFSAWMILGTLAMALMLVLTWFGLLLRFFLLVVSLLGFKDRRKRNGSTTSIAAPSAIEI